MIEYCVHGTVTMQFHHLIKASSEQAAENDTKIDLENNAVEFSSVFGNLEISHISHSPKENLEVAVEHPATNKLCKPCPGGWRH